MTHLNKKITRTVNLSRGKFAITLLPSMEIEFRKKDSKVRIKTHLEACYNLAIIDSAMSEWKLKHERYKEKKAMGHKKLREPKKPRLRDIFSEHYFEALKHVK